MPSELMKVDFQDQEDLFKAPDGELIDLEKQKSTEMVIGLCGPLGTPLTETGEDIQNALKAKYGYDVVIIRMSQKIRDMIKDPEIPVDRYGKIKALIKYGDFLRARFGNQVLAEIAISEIAADRAKFQPNAANEMPKTRRKCYIIDSIKNNGELELFRRVYGEMFYFIGVYSPVEMRISSLEASDIDKSKVHDLIDQDSGEEVSNGQKVEKTFPEADYFLRLDTDAVDKKDEKISRMLSMLFTSGIHSPTVSETAMYSAYSAAANSACLSRQVGACLVSKNGALVSVGWNDVPKAQGGMYEFGKGTDNRCFNYGDKQCHNDHEKSKIIKKITESILIDKRFPATLQPSQITHIQEAITNTLSQSRIGGLPGF